MYPTVSYALKDDYLKSFQKKHQDFVRDNALPEKNIDKVLIKYYSSLEKIIEKPVAKIPSNKYYIWTKDHVKNYMTGKTAFIWFLRVYKLKVAYWAEPTPGAIRFANLKEDVSLEDMMPILSDQLFEEVMNNLK